MRDSSESRLILGVVTGVVFAASSVVAVTGVGSDGVSYADTVPSPVEPPSPDHVTPEVGASATANPGTVTPGRPAPAGADDRDASPLFVTAHVRRSSSVWPAVPRVPVSPGAQPTLPAAPPVAQPAPPSTQPAPMPTPLPAPVQQIVGTVVCTVGDLLQPALTMINPLLRR
jgi:hypothetical protein